MTKYPFFFENRAVYEVVVKNIVEPIWRIQIAYWVLKAKNTQSDYVMPLDCSLQQWLHERTSILRYSTLLD